MGRHEDGKMENLRELILQITGPDEQAVRLAEERQAALVKPPGSLGVLESLSIQLAGITGKVNNEIGRQCIAIFCADNGVTVEGVASAPQSVTMSQTLNFTRRLTGVGALARYFGVDLLVVDVGINGTVPEECRAADFWKKDGRTLEERVTDRKIAFGTKNLAQDPAMSREEVVQALLTGFEATGAVKKAGHQCLGIGEMGIGNTTTAAAVLSALLGLPAEETVGRGGGINDACFAKKKRIVNEALKRHGLCGGLPSGLSPDSKKDMEAETPPDVIAVLAAVGGFDIAAMAGAFLGAASFRLPAVVDGYISAAAALCAARLEEQVKGGAGSLRAFLFGSHLSWERGYKAAADALGIRPILNLDMRLGEGSGCPLAFQILEGACAAMNGMATFAEAAIKDDYLAEIRKGGCF